MASDTILKRICWKSVW